jgi:hypothetical protein
VDGIPTVASIPIVDGSPTADGGPPAAPPLPALLETLHDARDTVDPQLLPGGHRVEGFTDEDGTPPSGGRPAWRTQSPYRDTPTEYVGYWKNLRVTRTRLRSELSVAWILLMGLAFIVPLLIGGIAFIPVLVAETLVAAMVIVSAPGGKVVPGHAYFRKRLVVPVVVVVAAVGFGAFWCYDDILFGTWSLSGTPPRILACGAQYDRAGPPIPPPKGVALHRVWETPSGEEILGTADCGRAGSVRAFVAVGHGRVVPYDIAGATG